jgi:hypothetical protein
MTGVVIEQFRAVHRRGGTLRGFVRARFQSGLVMDDIAVHLGALDGLAWCSPPARPLLDNDGNVVRDPETGKIRYVGLIAFSTRNVRASWQRQILRALHERFPDALNTEPS